MNEYMMNLVIIKMAFSLLYRDHIMAFIKSAGLLFLFFFSEAVSIL